MSGELNIIPKITVKDVGGDPKKVLGQDAQDARHPLMRIYGIASGVKQVKGTDRLTGETTVHSALKGEFRAINLMTGERYGSGIAYLPGGIHELIQSPLDVAKAENEEAEIKFAFDVFSRKTTALAGYGYVAVDLAGVDVSDPVAEIEKTIAATPGAFKVPEIAAKETEKLAAPKK